MDRTKKIGWWHLFPVGLFWLLICGCGDDKYISNDASNDFNSIDLLKEPAFENSEILNIPEQGQFIDKTVTKDLSAITPYQIMIAAGNRLCDLQSDITEDNAHNGKEDGDLNDGGWDWEIASGQNSHSNKPSPENIYGATALGLWSAQELGFNQPRFATALNDTFIGMIRRPDIDSGPDFIFLIMLADQLRPEYAVRARELARNRYDAKLAQYGGAQKLAEAIISYRHIQSNYEGLIPYDIGTFIVAAQLLNTAFPSSGYLEHAKLYGKIVSDTIRYGIFNINDDTTSFYPEGLAWAAVSLIWGQADRTLLATIEYNLEEAQLANGSWYFSSEYPQGDNEITALVIQGIAMAALKPPLDYGLLPLETAAREGSNWLTEQRLTNGGWNDCLGFENPMITGEIMKAFYFIPPDGPFLTSQAMMTNNKTELVEQIESNLDSEISPNLASKIRPMAPYF